MATMQEKLLKAQHDARVARAEAVKVEANVDYIAMMADIEIPTEDEESMEVDEDE